MSHVKSNYQSTGRILSDLIYCTVTKFLKGTFPLKDNLVILSKYIPDLLCLAENKLLI